MIENLASPAVTHGFSIFQHALHGKYTKSDDDIHETLEELMDQLTEWERRYIGTMTKVLVFLLLSELLLLVLIAFIALICNKYKLFKSNKQYV